MLSADEDITTELDKVVCKLMKLALRSSKGRQTPPPTRWMQCKLLDLLTLTEKAIGRRKKHFIQSYPVKAIEFDKPQEDEREQDIRVNEIVEKYSHLIPPIERTTNTDDTNGPADDIEDEDFLSITSNEFLKDSEYIEGISPSLVIPQPIFSTEAFEPDKPPIKENSLERTQAWLDEDIEVVPYAENEMNYEDISSGDTDHSVSNPRQTHRKSSKKHNSNNNQDVEELETSCKNSQSQTTYKFKINRENKNKKKTSNTRIVKKLTKKRSSYNSLVKNPGGKYSSAECESYVVRPKKKNKGLQSFNVTASKPIPESLIELCHPELKMDKGVKRRVTDNTNESSIVSSDQPSFNISATEESFLVDIISHDYEETIAMRRTIGTDTAVIPGIKKKKDQVETTSIDFDFNLLTKHEVSTENVHSQTIFLNDINEPSTSKGIRHNISTDVQCGPDTLAVYPMLSASTSLVRMPQVCSTGIKIYDGVAETKSKGTDFGTSTHDNNNVTTITPRIRLVGIKIKDSDVNICTKTECSTMIIADSSPPTSASTSQFTRKSAVNSTASSPETKLIKPVSSTLKIEDSGSEFCAASIASSSKTFPYFMNVSKNTSDALIETSSIKETTATAESSVTVNAKPRLCCGGVHVHSYRDRQISEDIVYQGEWQRYRPKALARKKTYNITMSRKATEAAARKKKDILKEKKVNSKEKVYTKRLEKKQMEVEPKKSMQIRNVKLHKVRKEDVLKDQAKTLYDTNSLLKISSNTMRIPRPIKTVTKVASKIGMSGITSKNAKSTFTVKKSTIFSNVTIKKENEKTPRLKKSYIPLYLKRTAQMSISRDKNSLNKSIDSADAVIKTNLDNIVNKIAPLVRSKTDEIRKDLLKFSDDLRENISYVVFRNDLEGRIESPDEQASENTDNDPEKSALKQLEAHQRSLSPQSLNSSTCSSPNSIATVRAVSTRMKNASNRRHSASSYKSSLNNSESDNPTPTKTKKIVKRCKTAKKAESKDIDNKENIPESTRNFGCKDRDKINKPPFVGRHKSVYIAQLKTGSSSTQNTLSRHKVQIVSNKSNIKIPTPKDDDDKPRSNSPTVSKKRSLKSDTSSIYEELNKSQIESYSSSDSANMVLVLEPQSTYEELSGTQNISQIPSKECPAKSDNNLIAEWVQNSSLHSHASSILNSMRQLLDETLDLIISPHEHTLRRIDSKTVIISRENVKKLKTEKVESPRSNAGNVPGTKLNSSFMENDIENALNRTFDTVLGDESMLSLNDTRLTVTDLDLLSFKSMTSVSKYSEYFLADNEFDTSQEMEQTQNTTSVRDIFERKEPHMMQNIPGAFAVQAFSGFSLDAEPAGDQPDAVALIDSETGSVGLDFNRQATSEELFISGRSSDSYESCLIDDDAVVPNWLFQIISQQQSVEEDPEPALLGPVAAPLEEPLYDANGNVIEPAIVGVGTGAGDGRGMHSDHSQDSSGRGTSLSSSDTSSGQQSEAILIDPSAYTAQFDMLRDQSSSGLMTSSTTYRIDDDAGTLIGFHDDQTRTLNGASDIDADISSIDTDVPDSSDN